MYSNVSVLEIEMKAHKNFLATHQSSRNRGWRNLLAAEVSWMRRAHITQILVRVGSVITGIVLLALLAKLLFAS